MATPTRAEIETQISNVIAILQEHRKYAGTNSSGSLSNYIAREDTLAQSLEGDFSADVLANLDAFRGRIAAAVDTPNIAAMISPLLRTYAKFIGTVTETDDQTILTRITDYFIANTLRVTSRVFVDGTPSAGSNFGNGAINRLCTDMFNFSIENRAAEAKRAECVGDEHTGASEHEEIFEFRGEDAERDLLVITGTGKKQNINALSARNSLINNPSFSARDGSDSVPTAITDWTVGTIGNFELDATNFYRDSVGDTTPKALRIKANETVTQNFNVKGLTLDWNTPYYCQIAWNRSVYSGDGRLTLTMGDVSADVVLAAQSGWQILRIALGQNNWPRQFSDMENPTIKIQLSGRTTGSVLVDDVIFAPMAQFDG